MKLITKDDWELTLKELEGQVLQHTIQLQCLEGSIARVREHILVNTKLEGNGKDKKRIQTTTDRVGQMAEGSFRN